MRFPLISAGNFTFEDEPIGKGFIGGRIIATDNENHTAVARVYKKFHTGKTNKLEVLEQLMLELVPPASDENTEEKVET